MNISMNKTNKYIILYNTCENNKIAQHVLNIPLAIWYEDGTPNENKIAM